MLAFHFKGHLKLDKNEINAEINRELEQALLLKEKEPQSSWEKHVGDVKGNNKKSLLHSKKIKSVEDHWCKTQIKDRQHFESNSENLDLQDYLL